MQRYRLAHRSVRWYWAWVGLQGRYLSMAFWPVLAWACASPVLWQYGQFLGWQWPAGLVAIGLTAGALWWLGVTVLSFVGGWIWLAISPGQKEKDFEKAVDLPPGALRSLNDRLCNIDSELTRSLWQAHQKRLQQLYTDIPWYIPSFHLPHNDRYALTGLAFLLVLTYWIFPITPEESSGIVQEDAPFSYQLIVTPPSYSNLPDSVLSAQIWGDDAQLQPYPLYRGSRVRLANLPDRGGAWHLVWRDQLWQREISTDTAIKIKTLEDFPVLDRLILYHGSQAVAYWPVLLASDAPPAVFWQDTQQDSQDDRTGQEDFILRAYAGDDFGLENLRWEIVPVDKERGRVAADHGYIALSDQPREFTLEHPIDMALHPLAGFQVRSRVAAQDAVGQIRWSSWQITDLPSPALTEPLAQELWQYRYDFLVGEMSARRLRETLYQLQQDRGRIGERWGIYLALDHIGKNLDRLIREQPAAQEGQQEGQTELTAQISRIGDQLWEMIADIQNTSLVDQALAVLRDMQSQIYQSAFDSSINLSDLLERLEALEDILATYQQDMENRGIPGLESELSNTQFVETLSLSDLRQMLQSGDLAAVQNQLDHLSQALEFLSQWQSLSEAQRSDIRRNLALFRELEELLQRQRENRDQNFLLSQSTQPDDPNALDIDSLSQALLTRQEDLSRDFQQWRQDMQAAELFFTETNIASEEISDLMALAQDHARSHLFFQGEIVQAEIIRRMEELQQRLSEGFRDQEGMLGGIMSYLQNRQPGNSEGLMGQDWGGGDILLPDDSLNHPLQPLYELLEERAADPALAPPIRSYFQRLREFR